jgi:hypothetical protein
MGYLAEGMALKRNLLRAGRGFLADGRANYRRTPMKFAITSP